MVVVFNNCFLSLKTKKNIENVFGKSGDFCFWCFLCSWEAFFQRTKKSCFGCFLHCLRKNCSLCFLLMFFYVSLHVVSPLTAQNKGHGGWRWQSYWLPGAMTKTMVVLPWVNGRGCERRLIQCNALKGKAMVEMSWATTHEREVERSGVVRKDGSNVSSWMVGAWAVTIDWNGKGKRRRRIFIIIIIIIKWDKKK